ncbi:MAG: TraM recognition domain-containing protein [Pseudonocardia sp.]|nr:TraM recognition domain-containing protein [Pseudonocardia sp.]
MSRQWVRPQTLRRSALTGAGLLVLGIAAIGRPADGDALRLGFGFVVIGSILLGLHVMLLWRRHGGSSGQVHRWARRSRRNDGVASAWTLWRVASWRAMRKRATIVRPSFAQVPWWRRWRVPTTEFATALARVGLLRIWSSHEDVTVRIAGPRAGKTGELAGRIVEAPGAVIATSTRTDLVYLTGPIRALRGPVHVFNPSGIGALESTITFNPLSGCAQPRTAIARAADLVSGVSAAGRAGDMVFWHGQARRVLAALLHAAALDRRTMRDVLAWVADPDGRSSEIQQALRHSSEPAFELDAQQFLGTNERTRSSILSTIMPALGWLTDAHASAAATGGGFDVEELLDERGTVFMLGADDGQVAPLVAALTGHIAREARRLAALMPSGRLDPPLTLALDEAALICPIPLDNWTADMGGRGVSIHIAAQSRAQLRQRWGDTGAAAILNNAATLMIMGGTRDHEDLAAFSALTGERYEDTPTWDGDGDLHAIGAHRVPVLSPAQIAQLPAGRAVVIRRGMPPAIGHVQMAWKRRDVRAVARAERWARRLHILRARGADALDWTAVALVKLSPHLSRTAAEIRADNALRWTGFTPALDERRLP